MMERYAEKSYATAKHWCYSPHFDLQRDVRGANPFLKMLSALFMGLLFQ